MNSTMLNSFKRHLHSRNIPYLYFKELQRNYTAQFSSEWKSTIGLEVHAQISVASKLFSSGSSKYGLPTNSCVNLFDAAIPGTLPVLNKKAVELAVITSLALKCKVNPVSLFDRKHYFYADLPNGYQITQQRMPLAQNGSIDFAVFNPVLHKKPYYKTSKIKQIQLEQDSGKSFHQADSKETFVDLNRAGIALIEIVFEPDLEDAEEAAAVVKELCFILERVGSCSCKMEEGALRVDANVSVHKEGTELGVRTEIKNIGSIRAVAQAINYEISRQLNVIKSGGTVYNQTLAWHSVENKTVVLRDKEGHHDYRFMPEPNLPHLRVIVNEDSDNFLKDLKDKDRVLDLRQMRDKIPVLPQEERNLLLNKYKTSDLVAYNIVNIPEVYKYFIDIITEDPTRDVKIIYQVLLVSLLTTLNDLSKSISDCSISSSYLGELVDLRTATISEKGAQIILSDILNGSRLSPKEIVAQRELSLLPENKIKELCQKVIKDNPKALNDYLRGKRNVTQFFIKNVMKLTDKKATFVTVEKIVTKELEAERKKS